MLTSTGRVVATLPSATAVTSIIVHDGHLHHPHEGHVDAHVIEVSDENPEMCASDHRCGGHEAGHVHEPGCGHEAAGRTATT
jgi:hypothetical protein